MLPLLAVATLAAALAWLAAAALRRPPLPGTRAPPGPLRLPWLGDSLAALRDPDATREARHAQYGPVYASVFLGKRYVSVRGFDAVRRLLLGEHSLVEVEWPAAIRALLGDGSVSTTYHAAHRKLRLALAPAFSPRAVADAVPRIADILGRHFERWVEAGPGLAGGRAVKAATFEVVVAVFMGLPPLATADNLTKMTDLFDTWLGGFDPRGRFNGKLRAGLRAREAMMALIAAAIAPVVASRRALPRDARPPPTTVMERLVDAADPDGEELGERRLATIALNLLFAGHETSSQVLTHLLRTLAAAPELLADLRREQREVVAAHGAGITADALAAAPLAAACVKEQMRLRPVVGQLFRKALHPIQLTDGGGKGGKPVAVAAGDVVVLDLEHTMRADARWAGERAGSPLHPASFTPARWLDGSASAKKEGAFLPFGSGARMCVGWALANAELAAALALLARRFAWRLHHPDAPLAKAPAPRLPTDGLVVTFSRWEGGREE